MGSAGVFSRAGGDDEGDEGGSCKSVVEISRGKMCPSESARWPPLWTSGSSWANIRVIAAMCVPASTASNEPLAHPEALDRTRSPVTLSSLGPPPEPCYRLAAVFLT